MKRKTRRIVAAVVAAGVLAAGGAAITASNTVPPSVAGYGGNNITGATATSLKYDLSGDGKTITTAHLIFQEDLTAPISGNAASSRTVTAGFGENASLALCSIDGYSAGTGTTVTCPASGSYAESTATPIEFDVAVKNS